MPFVSGEEAKRIEGALPREVVAQGLDPVVALLVTLYILRIGRTSGEEMAASAGLPDFPAADVDRRGLAGQLRQYLAPEWAARLITSLERSLPTAGQEEALNAEEKLLATAIFSKDEHKDERTEPQRGKLRNVLSVISASSAYDRDDIKDWNRGLRAVSRYTRLMIEAVEPPRIGTMSNLAQPDSGLRTISTLGGALFLGPSIEVLTRRDSAAAPARYAALGKRFALLLNDMGGQVVNLPGPDARDRYIRNLQKFTDRGESVFAIEHPYHFRVLLEVLSDENRRYPAEPVLNVAALRLILRSTSFWSHVVWSREQLPVVVNLLASPKRQRADAYVQHYAAFGRTPNTSSFTHLDYEVHSQVGDDPDPATWPAEFQELHTEPVTNMPNSVTQVMAAISRERSLGRLWRGEPEESDLRWLCGQLVTWDGYQEPDAALAGRIWDSGRWTGQPFPVAALAEIRVGAWLLEALRLRLQLAVLPAIRDAEFYQDPERLSRERRADDELRCVLEVMALFSDEYLMGDEDGIPGLRDTLRQLRESGCFRELGPAMGERLDFLEGAIDAHAELLGTEIGRARAALESPEG